MGEIGLVWDMNLDWSLLICSLGVHRDDTIICHWHSSHTCLVACSALQAWKSFCPLGISFCPIPTAGQLYVHHCLIWPVCTACACCDCLLRGRLMITCWYAVCACTDCGLIDVVCRPASCELSVKFPIKSVMDHRIHLRGMPLLLL